MIECFKYTFFLHTVTCNLTTWKKKTGYWGMYTPYPGNWEVPISRTNTLLTCNVSITILQAKIIVKLHIDGLIVPVEAAYLHPVTVWYQSKVRKHLISLLLLLAMRWISRICSIKSANNTAKLAPSRSGLIFLATVCLLLLRASMQIRCNNQKPRSYNIYHVCRDMKIQVLLCACKHRIPEYDQSGIRLITGILKSVQTRPVCTSVIWVVKQGEQIGGS